MSTFDPIETMKMRKDSLEVVIITIMVLLICRGFFLFQ